MYRSWPKLVGALRHLLGCIVTLLLLLAPVRADREHSALRAFGIDEIRLGGMKHNLESSRGKGGVGYTFTQEGGLDVNAEVLFNSPWPKPENPSSTSCSGLGRCSARP